ncbi:hypothetical protein DFH09DRAFT_1428234 [Mycena vulgaris]|nr:hypothetical protein DFH09DRAFT_1428234 [Mycena vulgaris]
MRRWMSWAMGRLSVGLLSGVHIPLPRLGGALCLCFRTPTSTHLLALPITTKDAKELRQIARDSIHRTGSGADAASDNKESTSRVTDLAIDSPSVALELAGKVVDIVKETPLIAPVGALLSHILKLYDDMKTTKDKKDILAAHITGLSGYVCATVLQIETTKQSDLIQRLKTDLRTYADLIFKASDIVCKYDNQGTLSHVATHKQLGGKIDKINQELTSFGTRFWVRACSAVISQLLADEKLFQAAKNQRRPPAMAYFFFDFRNLETRSVEIALRGIILQLSAQCPDAYKCLDTHYAAGRTLPGYKDLLFIIPELLRQLGRTHIIIDALDECDTDDHDRLVELMSTFRQWNETQLHVLFNSQTRDIFTAGFDGVPHIALKYSITHEDIRHFVRTEIHTNINTRLGGPMSIVSQRKLLLKATGCMFFPAYLHLRTIKVNKFTNHLPALRYLLESKGNNERRSQKYFDPKLSSRCGENKTFL